MTYETAYPAFASGKDLVRSADAIIRGVAIKSRVEQLFPDVSTESDPRTNPQAGLPSAEVEQWREQSAVVVTVSTVRVEETIKGRAETGSLVEVSQLGGDLGDVEYRHPETTILARDGTSYVLFLAAHGDKPYDLLNPQQASYVAAADGSLRPVGAGLPDITDIRALKKAV